MNEVSGFCCVDFGWQVLYSMGVLSYNWEIQVSAVDTHLCVHIGSLCPLFWMCLFLSQMTISISSFQCLVKATEGEEASSPRLSQIQSWEGTFGDK